MTQTSRIPLFPLGVVLLPGMMLPLHIFEDRYKQMISECLATGSPFGIAFFDGQTIRSVGCMAWITDVIKQYDDGRMDIITRGGDRFVIRELFEEKAYLEAEVFYFDDEEELADDDLQVVIKRALNLINKVSTAPLGRGIATIDPKELAYTIAALEGFEPTERQGFLEMTSPSERLKRCVQALTQMVARKRLTRDIKQLIGGNGHPPKSILMQLKEQLKKNQ